MLLLRKILFYLFALIYLLVCPLIILYSIGYFFNPIDKTSIIKTGLIYLSTTPPGASVYVGNRRYTQKTPTILRDFLPGEYSLRLALDNYKPWTKKIYVEAGKAAVYDEIIFLPKQWKQKKLLPDKFNNLIPIPGSHYLLLAKGNRVEDYFIYSCDEKKGWPLFLPSSSFGAFRVLSYFIQPLREGGFEFAINAKINIFFRLDSKEGEKFLWVEFRKGKVRSEDLTELFPRWPFDVQWDPGESNQLFVFKNNYLNRLDVALKAVYPRYLENVRGYAIFDKAIYVVSEDSELLKIDYDKRERKVLLDSNILSRYLPEKKNILQVKVFPKDIILLLGENGELFANYFPHRILENQVRGFEFSSQNEKILIWQKDKLAVLGFLSPENKEEQYIEKLQLSSIFERGQDIEQCFWVSNSSHILFGDNGKLYLLELKGDITQNLHQLFEIKKRSSFLYLEQLGKIYFLDNSGILSSVELIPKKEIK